MKRHIQLWDPGLAVVAVKSTVGIGFFSVFFKIQPYYVTFDHGWICLVGNIYVGNVWMHRRTRCLSLQESCCVKQTVSHCHYDLLNVQSDIYPHTQKLDLSSWSVLEKHIISRTPSCCGWSWRSSCIKKKLSPSIYGNTEKVIASHCVFDPRGQLHRLWPKTKLNS